MKRKITACGNHILVEVVPAPSEAPKPGAIILPDNCKPSSDHLIVRSIGKEVKPSLKSELKFGDRIVASMYGVHNFEIDGKRYRVLHEDDIQGVYV